jgi:hypothetical protein
MMVSVFVGTSVDGFIARPNGDLDFLPPGGGEPHGYNKFIATVDAIVIGRKTFETVLASQRGNAFFEIQLSLRMVKPAVRIGTIVNPVVKQRQLTPYGLPRCGTRVRFGREPAKGFRRGPAPTGNTADPLRLLIRRRQSAVVLARRPRGLQVRRPIRSEHR